LSPLVSRRAVELLILDRNGRRLGDLAEFDGGSSRTVNEDDWITIPPGGFIATPLSFVAGRVPFSTESLPPGKYAIRLMVHDGFFSRRPDDLTSNALVEWKSRLPGEVVARKKPLPIEFVVPSLQ
jgi:hypothetical protein